MRFDESAMYICPTVSPRIAPQGTERIATLVLVPLCQNYAQIYPSYNWSVTDGQTHSLTQNASQNGEKVKKEGNEESSRFI